MGQMRLGMAFGHYDMQAPKIEKGKKFEEMGSPFLLLVIKYANALQKNKKVRKSVKKDWKILAQKAFEVLDDREFANST